MLLQRTHQLIQQALGQEKEKGTSNDGMEVGVCYLAPRNRKMVFASARFSLFCVENGEVSRYLSGTESIRRIFFASLFGISVWRGIASTWPV